MRATYPNKLDDMSESICTIIRACPLAELIIIHTTGSLEGIVEALALYRAHLLRVLVVTNEVPYELELRETTLIRLVEACTAELKTLVLKCSQAMTDAVLLMLSARCPKLESLHCANLGHVSQRPLGELGNSAPLKYFSLAMCAHASSRGIACMAKRAGRTLRLIDLSLVDGVNTDALDAMAKSCVNLERLEVNECPDVCAAGALQIASLPSLIEVGVNGCRGLRLDGIATLASAIPVVKAWGVPEACSLSRTFGNVTFRSPFIHRLHL